MYTLDHSLLDLARQIDREAPLSTPRGREILESDAIVRWVRRNLDGVNWPTDATRAAKALVRSLTDRLLDRLSPLSSRETVVGP